MRRNPLVASGILMGIGLGGLLDGIVFRQILQWHNMLSANLPINSLENAKLNTYWDGLFFAFIWLITVIGLIILWRVGERKDVPWSGLTYIGALFIGWGSYNVIEGLLNHIILRIHHIFEFDEYRIYYDIVFLIVGIVWMLVGLWFIKKGRNYLFKNNYS